MIDIQNLDFYYSKKKPLFQNLDLNLYPGKIYGLLGKNGTGKSSLLKLLTGGLFPKSGHVKINNVYSGQRLPSLLEDIFFLSEDYEMPNISIKNYLSAYAPFYKKFDNKKFNELLDVFEIPIDNTLAKMSYGQKKKVLISFGIATQARFLLMDEPTNGLDIPSKSQFRKALLSGFKQDQTVIISTHQIRDLNQLIESVIIIENGKIIFNKDVVEIEDKLTFEKSLSTNTSSNAIYSEMIAGGYINIYPNRSDEISEIELEVLFNAIIKDKESINQLF